MDMDSSPEEDFPSHTETTRVDVAKKPKVTAAIFYKKTSARPAAKSSSGHTSRQPRRDLFCNVEMESQGEKETATITDVSKVALNAHQEYDGSQAEMANIMMHFSQDLEDANIGVVEEEVPLEFLHAGSSAAPHETSPLLFTPEHRRFSSSSSDSIALVDTPTHPNTATVTTSTRMSATASKSAPLPENPSPSSQPSVSPSYRRSKVWDHFVTVGDGRLAKCKLCGREVSRGKVKGHLTNAGMNTHLRTHHKPVLLREASGIAAPSSKTKGSSVSSSATQSQSSDNQERGQGAEVAVHPSKGNQSTLEQFSGFHPRGISRQQSRKITRLIGELIAVGGAPFNMVEGEPFKRLLQAVAPQYIVPSRTTFSRSIVPALYKSCVDLLKEELGRAAGQSVHLTTDLWSAPSGQHAFLSLTAHWWQPTVIEIAQTKSGTRSTGASVLDKTNQGHRSFLLHAEVLDEQHTSQNITRALQKMVGEWLGEHGDTHPKMGFVVTDGAANMKKALRDGHFVGVRCAAHVLHLVVKAGLEDTSESNTKLTEVLESCRKIAGHFHRSVKDSHILRREQSRAGVPQHRLKQDVSTRWNSTLEMLERILEQQKAIHAISHEHYIGVTRGFSREEWTIVAQLVAVLSPFRAVTENLSQENASLAQVIPLFSHLVTRMDAIMNNRQSLSGGYLVGDVASLVRILHVELQRRIKELTETCPELMLATICDPRIKGKMALQAGSLTSWRDKLITTVCDKQRQLVVGQEREDEEEAEEDDPAEMTATISNTAAPSSRAADFWAETLQDLVGQTRQPSRIPRDKVADMIKNYLTEPHLLPNADAMKYWDERRAIWPALSMVAQELLSCPPTSVQSERVFSVTGNILCPQRSQLAPQLMEQMTFLKVNLPKLGYPALNFETS